MVVLHKRQGNQAHTRTYHSHSHTHPNADMLTVWRALVYRNWNRGIAEITCLNAVFFSTWCITNAEKERPGCGKMVSVGALGGETIGGVIFPKVWIIYFQRVAPDECVHLCTFEYEQLRVKEVDCTFSWKNTTSGRVDFVCLSGSLFVHLVSNIGHSSPEIS